MFCARARKIGVDIAEHVRKQLDQIIHPKLLLKSLTNFKALLAGLSLNLSHESLSAYVLVSP